LWPFAGAAHCCRRGSGSVTADNLLRLASSPRLLFAGQLPILLRFASRKRGWSNANNSKGVRAGATKGLKKS